MAWIYAAIYEYRSSGALYWVNLSNGDVSRAVGPVSRRRCLEIMQHEGMDSFADRATPEWRRAGTLSGRQRAVTAFVREHWGEFREVDYDDEARELYEQRSREAVPLDDIKDMPPRWRLSRLTAMLRRRPLSSQGLYCTASAGPYDILAEPSLRRWYCYHRDYHALTGSWHNLCRLGLADDWAYRTVWAWFSEAGALRHARRRLEQGIDKSEPESEGFIRRPDGSAYWWYVWWPADDWPNVPKPVAQGPWASEEAARRRHPGDGLTVDASLLEDAANQLERQPDVDARRSLFVRARTAAEAVELAQRWASPVWWVMSAWKQGTREHLSGPYLLESEARAHDPSIAGTYVVQARSRSLAAMQVDRLAREQSLRFWYVGGWGGGDDPGSRDRIPHSGVPRVSGPYGTREEAEQAHPGVCHVQPDFFSGEGLYRAHTAEEAIDGARSLLARYTQRTIP